MDIDIDIINKIEKLNQHKENEHDLEYLNGLIQKYAYKKRETEQKKKHVFYRKDDLDYFNSSSKKYEYKKNETIMKKYSLLKIMKKARKLKKNHQMLKGN